jgi:hypothetical protein
MSILTLNVSIFLINRLISSLRCASAASSGLICLTPLSSAETFGLSPSGSS